MPLPSDLKDYRAPSDRLARTLSAIALGAAWLALLVWALLVLHLERRGTP